MKIIYPDEPVNIDKSLPSIMLCGPTPRSGVVKSWRPEAIDLLNKLGFSGTVLVPERRDWATGFYEDQVEWEWTGLENCSVIVFWVPRNLETMPAFTTNVEFGGYVRSGRAYYGRPDGCPKNGYLDWLYTKVTKRDHFNSLEKLLSYIVTSLF